MGPPEQITPQRLGDYLEVLSKAVFQAGISWQVVEAKWDGFRAAFASFDPETVASFTDDDVERLMSDPGIVRNRRKIQAAVRNAQVMLELDREYDGFGRYLRSQPDYEALVADLRGNFKFVGDSGAYFFLSVVGEPVPPHEEWMAAHPPRAARRPKA
ncbi:MAG TPA: DNA-3-methyladenine glycosylase I [Thermoleophilia bacterium]|nr:DNA-3-methyladenine glycosylase I [Thermoleophilia bacterium]